MVKARLHLRSPRDGFNRCGGPPARLSSSRNSSRSARAGLPGFITRSAARCGAGGSGHPAREKFGSHDRDCESAASRGALETMVAEADTGGRKPGGVARRIVFVIALGWSLFQVAPQRNARAALPAGLD